ncbi:MAG: hypothetical protein ACOX3W_02000 [Christensenellaceae bacterium]|jgi:hypothetical protein
MLSIGAVRLPLPSGAEVQENTAESLTFWILGTPSSVFVLNRTIGGAADNTQYSGADTYSTLFYSMMKKDKNGVSNVQEGAATVGGIACARLSFTYTNEDNKTVAFLGYAFIYNGDSYIMITSTTGAAQSDTRITDSIAQLQIG